jgi:segregation and condensation protein B
MPPRRQPTYACTRITAIMDEQTIPPQMGQAPDDPFEQGPNRIEPSQELDPDVLVEDVSAEPSQQAQAENQAGPPAGKDETPAEPQLTQAQLTAMVEAVLFATDAPLTAAKIAQVTKAPGQRAVKDIIAALNARYEQMNCAFRIEGLAGGYQMLTSPEFHDVLGRLLRVRSETKLSPSALETLSIVAYRQPILRADIESIRGVASGEMLRGLMERQLVKIVGRAEVIGRPMLYGTTRRFLEIFGLAGLEDLPNIEALRTGNKPAQQNPAPANATTAEVSVPTAPETTTAVPPEASEPIIDQPAAEQGLQADAQASACENPSTDAPA